MKILILFCYFFAMMALNIITLAYGGAQSDLIDESITDYLTCESIGVRPGLKCDRGKLEEVDIVILVCLSAFLLGLLPVVSLVYIVNVKELKMKWQRWYRST